MLNDVQFLNALLPMNETELGMVMLESPVHPLNAETEIAVTELGMVEFWQPAMSVLEAVSMIALQLLRESYVELPLSTSMLVSLLQQLKA